MSYPVKLLGEICEISTGSTDTKDATANGQYPLFDRSKKIKASDKYLFDCEALIMPGEGTEFLPRHFIGKFDLHQRAYALFNFTDLVNPRYLYFYLVSVKDYFADNAVGATVKSLRRRHFTDLEILLPPLDKQAKIVQKLDSIFSAIDLLEENLEQGSIKVNQLSQSLLSASFNSIELIGQLKEFASAFTIIPDSRTKVKSSSYLEAGSYAVVDQGKDLIAGYTDSNPTVDNDCLPVIVFGDHTRAVKYIDFPFAAGADGTQILKPSPLTDPKFAFYSVQSAVSRMPSKGYARHFGDLKKMHFPIPPLEEQQTIVEKLDRAFAEIELLKTQIKVEKECATELRWSLLSTILNDEKLDT